MNVLPHRSRFVQVVALLLLAPICAEYLSAYDDSTGDVRLLVGNLVIFVPLYGAPALLIREVARRKDLGWVGILLLGAAFGLMQAGVVDQSLFSTDYRAIDGWEEGFAATAVPLLGISGFNALNFVGGHAIVSIAAPIALVEGARPSDSHAPWLGRPGLVVTAVAWLAASAVVLQFHLQSEATHASPTQVGITVAIVVALVVVAFRQAVRARRRTPRTGHRTAPRVTTVGALALLLALVSASAPETWLGVAMSFLALAVAFAGLVVGSRRVGWGLRHVVVVAAAPLVVRAVLAFTYDPLVGEVSAASALGHHVAMAVIVLGATALALRPRRRRPAEAVSASG